LPRFEKCSFLPQFPFASILLEEDDVPMQVELIGWSPFIPGNESKPDKVADMGLRNLLDSAGLAVSGR